MVHPTDQEDFEILPSGRDKFFFIDLEAEISFLRDETGEVTELILHQGADYPAKKLK